MNIEKRTVYTARVSRGEAEKRISFVHVADRVLAENWAFARLDAASIDIDEQNFDCYPLFEVEIPSAMNSTERALLTRLLETRRTDGVGYESPTTQALWREVEQLVGGAE